MIDDLPEIHEQEEENAAVRFILKQPGTGMPDNLKK